MALGCVLSNAEVNYRMCYDCGHAALDPGDFGQKSIDMAGVSTDNTAGESSVAVQVTPTTHTLDYNPTFFETPPRTREQYKRAIDHYHRYVFDEYGFNVLTPEMVNIDETGRFTHLLGRCDTDGIRKSRIQVSWQAYQHRGYEWERMKETVRHELAHSSTYAECGYMGHGPTFIEEAVRLDCNELDRYDGEPDPQYFIACMSCGRANWRKQKSKFVKKPNNTYRCSGCGETDWKSRTTPVVEWHPMWSKNE